MPTPSRCALWPTRQEGLRQAPCPISTRRSKPTATTPWPLPTRGQIYLAKNDDDRALDRFQPRHRSARCRDRRPIARAPRSTKPRANRAKPSPISIRRSSSIRSRPSPISSAPPAQGRADGAGRSERRPEPRRTTCGLKRAPDQARKGDTPAPSPIMRLWARTEQCRLCARAGVDAGQELRQGDRGFRPRHREAEPRNAQAYYRRGQALRAKPSSAIMAIADYQTALTHDRNMYDARKALASAMAQAKPKRKLRPRRKRPPKATHAKGPADGAPRQDRQNARRMPTRRQRPNRQGRTCRRRQRQCRTVPLPATRPEIAALNPPRDSRRPPRRSRPMPARRATRERPAGTRARTANSRANAPGATQARQEASRNARASAPSANMPNASTRVQRAHAPARERAARTEPVGKAPALFRSAGAPASPRDPRHRIGATSIAPRHGAIYAQI